MLTTEKAYNYLDYITPIILFVSFFECYLGVWRIASIVKFLSILLTLILLSKGAFKLTSNVFKLFFLLSCFSIISYLYNGRPLVCMSSDIMNTLPAMLFFLVGMNDIRPTRSYYDRFMYASGLIFLLGLLCYVFTPNWYTESLVAAHNASKFNDHDVNENMLLESLRFSGFFEDSYPISLLSVYAVSISLFGFFRQDGKLKYSFLCFIIAFISAIVCMHRVSIACAILIFFVYVCYEIYKKRAKQILKIIVIGTVLVVLVTTFSEGIQERLVLLGDMLTERTSDMSFSSAYGERQGVSDKLMDQWTFIIFGHGIGSGGPTSRFSGYGGVTDAAYTKLLFENGIVGMGLFVALIVSSCFRGLKYFKYYIVELSIIGFICLAMTGSNSLSLAYLYILPFWYALGRIWNRNYLQYAIKNKIHV